MGDNCPDPLPCLSAGSVRECDGDAAPQLCEHDEAGRDGLTRKTRVGTVGRVGMCEGMCGDLGCASSPQGSQSLGLAE